MSDRDDLTALSDDDLVELFRAGKEETGGGDPALTPPGRERHDAVRAEMERRGIAPDREDVIPDDRSLEEEPVVDDHA